LSEPARGRGDLVELTLDMAEKVGEAHLDAQLAMQATRLDERRSLRSRPPIANRRGSSSSNRLT
ncbi:MAG TPA: hypothetical protein VKB85_16485, partial [Propionibacteriaceae bacterium]|nr:hypothetical protein [Propionibacteriaceae bacterium]